jgi:hypothetical protein
MRSTSISSTKFSIALRSPDMHTRNQINRLGEQENEVIGQMVSSRKNSAIQWILFCLGYYGLQKVVSGQRLTG